MKEFYIGHNLLVCFQFGCQYTNAIYDMYYTLYLQSIINSSLNNYRIQVNISRRFWNSLALPLYYFTFSVVSVPFPSSPISRKSRVWGRDATLWYFHVACTLTKSVPGSWQILTLCYLTLLLFTTIQSLYDGDNSTEEDNIPSCVARKCCRQWWKLCDHGVIQPDLLIDKGIKNTMMCDITSPLSTLSFLSNFTNFSCLRKLKRRI